MQFQLLSKSEIPVVHQLRALDFDDAVAGAIEIMLNSACSEGDLVVTTESGPEIEHLRIVNKESIENDGAHTYVVQSNSGRGHFTTYIESFSASDDACAVSLAKQILKDIEASSGQLVLGELSVDAVVPNFHIDF